MLGGIHDSFLKDYPSLLREILWSRGFRDESSARKFLSPSLADFVSPMGLLKDLDLALAILLKARELRDQIVIFGDYDVDGTTSTALLVTGLRHLGFSVSSFIPHRMEDGYGVTKKAAEKVIQKFPDAKVIVTCDSGIASHEGIEILKSRGLSVIVTDHHEVPKHRVAADAILNPKQLGCQYPDKKLAGVGVAFLLLTALRRALDARDFSLSQFLDLVAVGTVCDVAELTGGNRILVKHGLPRISESSFRGLKVLASRASAEPRAMKVRDLGFFIGPRLNASGRLGDPELGLRCLLADDFSMAVKLADELEKRNFERRALQDIQVKDAQARAQKFFEQSPQSVGIVVESPDYHLGIVGLVASKLSESYKRPACVMTKVVDEHELAFFGESRSLWKGSLRAPLGYHLAEALNEIRAKKPDLLRSGGGHALAAGIAIEEENLVEFKQAFAEAIGQQVRREVSWTADSVYRGDTSLDGILDYLEPLGQGNPPPLIEVRDFQVDQVQCMKEIHMKVRGLKASKRFSLLQFQSPWVKILEKLAREEGPLHLDFLGELSENEWQGKKTTEFLLKEILDVRVKGRSQNVRPTTGAKIADEIREVQSLS